MQHRRFAIGLIVLCIASCGEHSRPPAFQRQSAAEPAEASPPAAAPALPAAPASASSSEPNAPAARTAIAIAAARHLDERVADWMAHPQHVGNNFDCAMTCHTALPYALSLPVVGDDKGRPEKLVAAVTARVESSAHWHDALPFYGAKTNKRGLTSQSSEAVLNAAASISFDRAKGREPGATTRAAFERMWEMQRSDGGFEWLDFGLEPFEHGNELFGAAIAARAASMLSPAEAGAAKDPIHRLIGFIGARRSNPASPLFERALALWATAPLEALTEPDRAKIADEIVRAQNSDGAFSWRAAGVVAKEKRASIAESGDSLPTAVLLLGLCSQRGGGSPEAARGIDWLRRQAKAGMFPSQSPNRDRPFSNLVMSDAATGYAVLAMSECEAQPGTPTNMKP